VASAPIPVSAPASARRPFSAAGPLVLRGGVAGYLGLVVALPIAALVWAAAGGGLGDFWDTVSADQGVAALKLTVVTSVIVVAINVVMGTALAWVLVRDDFRGKGVVDAVIDLPFALPTIVSGLVLLTLYGPSSPIGVDVAYSRTAIGMALLFVTLPFVVRSVQPVLIELEREAEEAAASLGAAPRTTFRRVILPSLVPAICAGAGLALARALGEFGSIVLLAGNVPFKTEVSSIYIFGLIEQDDSAGAAAISVVLLLLALAAQVGFTLLRRRLVRHDR
jgi:sulfate/thiosulfate transport system permease protein